MSCTASTASRPIALVTLATKMRFTQQSKYFPDKAAVHSRQSAPVGLRPWQDWGETLPPKN
jgi:hypothetical protein